MVIDRLSCVVRVGSLRAELHRGRTLRWAAEASWEDVTSLRERVAELAGRAELPVWGRTIRFQLEPGLVQRRELRELPPVRSVELERLLALTPNRYFRRAAASLVTGGRWGGPRHARVAIAVAADLPLLQALVAGSTEAGLGIEGIEVQGMGITLLPPDEAQRRVVRRARWTRWIVVAAGVAWAVLGGALVLGRVLERRRIETRLAELQRPLAAVLESEARADSVERMISRLDRARADESAVVGTLFRVAISLPDSTFITQLRVDSVGVGLVSGAARRPARVLAALETRAGLASPKFAGRTTPDVVSGRQVERFAIGFGTPEGRP